MKILQKIVVILLMVMGLSSGLLAEVRNFYINGVGNSQEDAEKSADAVMVFIPEIGKVRSLYNETYGVVRDLLEAARQSLDIDLLHEKVSKYFGNGSLNAQRVQESMDRYQESIQRVVLMKSAKLYALAEESQKISLWDKLMNPISFKDELLEIGFTNGEITALGGMDFLSDSVEAMSAVYESIFNYLDFYKNAADNADLQKMADYLQPLIDNGDKINIIAHSQGNLFANKLLNDYLTGVSRKNVRMLSVATPDDKVFGEAGGAGYITLKEDMFSWLFIGSYPGNFTNYSKFPEYENMPWYLKYNPISVLLWPTLKSKEIKENNILYYGGGDLATRDGHNFIKCYLKEGSASKAWIREHFLKNYNELKALDKPEKRENVWLDKPTLSKTTIKQGELVKMTIVQGYSSNETPSNLKSKVCYRITTRKSWDTRYMVKGDVYSNSYFSEKEDNEEEHVNLLVPTTLKPGSYYFGMKADCDSGIDETSENDNYEYVSIKVVEGPKEDIYIKNFKVEKTQKSSGLRLRISGDVSYQGSRKRDDVGSIETKYYISKYSTFNKSNAIYIDNDLSTIGTDDYYDGEYDYYYIPSSFSGRYYVHMVTDSNNRIKESDEKNNIKTMRIDIKPRESDFYLSGARVSDVSVYRGQKIKAYVTARYKGNVEDKAMNSVYTSYYAFCGNGLEYLDYDSSGLGSDDTSNDEKEYITIPSDCKKGVGYIVFWIDNKNGVSQFKETNEDNNIQLVKIQIR